MSWEGYGKKITLLRKVKQAERMKCAKDLDLKKRLILESNFQSKFTVSWLDNREDPS